MNVLGMEPTGKWLKVETPDGSTGWMLATYLRVNINLSGIETVDVPPTPTSLPPIAVPTSALDPTIEDWLTRNDADMFANCAYIGTAGAPKFQCRWMGEPWPTGVYMDVIACKGDKAFPDSPPPDCFVVARFTSEGDRSSTVGDDGVMQASASGGFVFCDYTNAENLQLFSEVPCGSSREFKWGISVVAGGPPTRLFTYGPMRFRFQAALR